MQVEKKKEDTKCIPFLNPPNYKAKVQVFR